MGPEEFRRVREAFDRALELPAAERNAFAEATFGDEAELRAELEAMLRGNDEDDGFLRPPSSQTLSAVAARHESTLAAGASLGDFELVRTIGSGGMGTVWEAVQHRPRRTVALKTLRAGMAPEAHRRFEEEARILARLDHPGIARILAAGVHGDEPWFAMEFVEGARTITQWVHEEELDVRAKIELVMQVGDAVHHGHLRGIIHRDLKPDNVLVTREGRPVVIDFGIARATDVDVASATLTAEGQLVGTLLYMSPEQVAGKRDLVDVRTDVHALGVLLFEVLAGRPPWDAARPMTELAHSILNEDPAILSNECADISPELDWIVGRALEKELERRYDSAGDLVADLRRHLNDEPLSVGPPSAVYRWRKFARRNRALVVSSAVGFALLVLGAAGTSIGLVRALNKQAELEVAKGQAEEAAARATAVNEYMNKILSAPDPLGDLMQMPSETTVGDLLDGAGETIAQAFPGRPDVEAETRLLIGNTYKNQGRYADAEEHFAQAVELYRSLHEGPHVDVARAERLLATSLTHQGRGEEAVALLERALTSLRELLGDAHLDVHRTRSNLGWTLMKLGHVDDAEEHVRSVLAWGEGQPDQLNIAASAANNLGRIRRMQGDLAGAEEAYRKALELWERNSGERHAVVGVAKSNLGFLLYTADRLDEARTLLEESVSILESAAENRFLGAALVNLASAYEKLGLATEAEQGFERAVAAYEQSAGVEHADYRDALERAVYARWDRGALEEALDGSRRLVELYDGTGSEPDKTLQWRIYTTELEAGLGLADDPVAAMESYHEALRRAHGDGHEYTQVGVRALIRLHRFLGNEDEVAAWELRRRP